jgi:hypothetical protein
MIRPLQMSVLEGVDLVPQAIIKRPVSFFAKKLNNVVKDHDDLD